MDFGLTLKEISQQDSDYDDVEANSFINFYLGINSSNSIPQINMANIRDSTTARRKNESIDTSYMQKLSINDHSPSQHQNSYAEMNNSVSISRLDTEDRPERDHEGQTSSVFYQKKGQTVFDFLKNVSLTSVPSVNAENYGFASYILSSNNNSESNLMNNRSNDRSDDRNSYDRNSIISGSRQLIYTKQLKEEVLQWYNRLPLPHNERSSTQLVLLNVLIRDLVELLYFASESFYEDNVRRQIECFLEGLLSTNHSVRDRSGMMKKFTDELLKSVLNLNIRLLTHSPLAKHEISVKHKELKVEIQGWLDKYLIDFDESMNRSKLVKIIINKLGSFNEGTRVIDTNKPVLLRMVHSIIKELPINGSHKIKHAKKWDMANDLTDRLIKALNSSDEDIVQPAEFFDIKTIQLHNKIRDEVKVEVYRYFGKFVLAPAILDMICNIVVYPNGSNDRQMRSDICNLIQMTKRSTDPDKILLCIDNFLKKVRTLLSRTKSEHLRESSINFPSISSRLRDNVQIMHSSMTNLELFNENKITSQRGEMLMRMINEYMKKTGVQDVLTKEALIAMLMNEHKNIKQYAATDSPDDRTTKPISLQNFYMELEIVRTISEWISHLPLKQNFNKPENEERTLLICDMANDVCDLIENNNNIIEDENELWQLIMLRMRELPLLKGHDAKIPYLVNALTDQLENLIIPRKLKGETALTDEQSAQTNYISKNILASQKDDMDIYRLTKVITDWLAKLPTKDVKNVEERIQRNLQIDALAKYIHFIKNDLHNALTSSDKEKLVTYLRDWLDRVLKPNFKAKYAEIMLQLMQRVKIIRREHEATVIVEFSAANTPRQKIISNCPAFQEPEPLAEEKSEENCTNTPCCMLEACLPEQNVPTFEILLHEHVSTWANKLGLKGDKATLMRNRQCLLRNVLKTIGDLNSQPNLDQEEYAERLEKEVSDLLDKLPPYKTVEKDKEKLKANFIPGVVVAVAKLKDLEAAETYKNALEDAAAAVLPLHMCCSKQAEMTLLKTTIAEEFIIGDCDADTQNGCYTALKLHKIQVLAQIHRAIDDGALPDCNPIQIKNNIKKALFTIPLPSKHVLDVEIKIIRTKNLVSQWFESLPLMPPTRPNDEVDRDKMKSYLAIRLYDAVIVPAQPRGKVLEIVVKVLAKAPLKPGQESHIEKMANQLIDRLEASDMYKKPEDEKTAENNAQIEAAAEPVQETSLFIDQPKNCIDLLYEAIEKWFQSIRLFSTSPEDEEKNSDLKAQLELKLGLRIMELDSNDQMLNNTSLFREKLSDAINEIIDCLPEEAKQEREALLEQLVETIDNLQPEMRKERARSCYKEELHKIIINEIPTYNQMTPERKEKIKLFACQIIDEFIECTYSTESKEKSHSVKVLEIAKKMFSEFKSKHDAMDPDHHKNLLLCKLSKVPTPDKESIFDELTEVRVKNEISKWYKGLPGHQSTASQAMHNYRVIDILAKKLIELEKAEDVVDDKQEICDFIIRFMRRMQIYEEDPTSTARALMDRLKAVSFTLKGLPLDDTRNNMCNGNGQGGPCKKPMCPRQKSIDIWSEGFCRITVYPQPGAGTSPSPLAQEEPEAKKNNCKGSVCNPIINNIINQNMTAEDGYCTNLICPRKIPPPGATDLSLIDSIEIESNDVDPIPNRCPFFEETPLAVRQYRSNEIIPSDDKYQILICPLNQPCPSEAVGHGTQGNGTKGGGGGGCDIVCNKPVYLFNQVTASNTREIDPYEDVLKSCCCNCGTSEPTQTAVVKIKKSKKRKGGGGGGKKKKSKDKDEGGGGGAPPYIPRQKPVCPPPEEPPVCPPCAPCRRPPPCPMRMPPCQSFSRAYCPRLVDRACGARSCNANAGRFISFKQSCSNRPCMNKPCMSSDIRPRYSNCMRGNMMPRTNMSSCSMMGRRCVDSRIQTQYWLQLFNDDNVKLNKVSTRWKTDVGKALEKMSSEVMLI